MLGRILSAVLLVGLCATLGWGYFIPPDAPDWWKTPDDERDYATRCQYHSFINHPIDLVNPDYDYTGFMMVMTDEWVVDGSLGNYFSQQHTQIEYGDGIGLLLGGPSRTLTKVMDNQPNENKIKHWVVGMVWRLSPMSPPSAEEPALSVIAEGNVSYDSSDSMEFSNGWVATVWRGTIAPQPDSETFTVTFPTGGQYWVDSIWMGTTCVVPEPCTVGLLAIGGLMLRRRR